MTKRGSISRKIVIGGGRRIVLYNWALSDEPRVRNLVCLDSEDRVVWRADLPASDAPDCFTKIDQEGGVIVADTYRGARLHLSSGTGLPVVQDRSERIAC